MDKHGFPVERLVVVVHGHGELLLADGKGRSLAPLQGQRRQRGGAEAAEGGAVGSARDGGGVGGSEAVWVCIG